MRCSALVVWGVVLSVARCSEGPGGDPMFEIHRNVTAVLGEAVDLICAYRGDSQIFGAEWTRRINSKRKSKGLAGFENGIPYARTGFSIPVSMTNLTVRMEVLSVDAEGEYVCEFESEEEYYSNSLFLSIAARPNIQIQLTTEMLNGSHYQSVWCSAVSGKPPPRISWSVGGRPAPDYPFTITVNNTAHTNGTSTLISTLRFPTHLQNEDNVTCTVYHPTFSDPVLTTMRVETYMTPNVSVKAEMVERGGSEFWVVSCVSSGGRPDTDISLVLNSDEEPQREDRRDSDTQTSSYLLPAAVYEGQNVTCVFGHPRFTHPVSMVTTLPSFYVSGVQWFFSSSGNSNSDFQDSGSVELWEGQNDVVIGLRVAGNVPRYNLSCSRDDGALPAGVEAVDGLLTVRGQVGLQHAGLYDCWLSYHHVRAGLQLNITVKPQDPQLIPPTVDLHAEDGVIECSAAGGVPAANMSWLLPEGVSEASWFNFTSPNGSYTVRSVLLLPACSPRERAATSPEHHRRLSHRVGKRRGIHRGAHLMNVSVQRQENSPLWTAVCDYRGPSTSVDLAWLLPGQTKSQTSLELEQEGRFLKARLTYQFSLSRHEGQNLTCVYQYERGSTERTVHVPRYYISAVRVQNHTTPLQSRYSGETIAHRLTLQENRQNQRILLRVEGSVPDYSLICKRSDGSLVQMERDWMLFRSVVTEQDGGLYTCQASFYHHTATVSFQVDVMCEDRLLLLVSLVCISSASVIVIVAFITCWACCIANKRTQQKGQEVLSPLTALMQEPGSPGARKPAIAEDSNQYAQLVHYAIVFEHKSTV
ncbi:unnamed protein product [Tetraodon nigroviridis]|uniref:(spotted green pufferfish) hypothetical protein n=1 Tax=Tetraodon nigroviridis TaxID=99883 RepID=Q4RRJ9_TETNG|nr:unnamed protein product [Tetraodon nigroviridis]